jgi:hypothetical protein
MSKRTKTIILAVVLVQIAAVLFLLVVPAMVRALPGEMRVRLAQVPLGETLLDFGVTPLPTALPAPANVIARPDIRIPTVVVPTEMATVAPMAVPNHTVDTAVTPFRPHNHPVCPFRPCHPLQFPYLGKPVWMA